MSTEIFYFSGTGNSLFVARQLGESLSDNVSVQPMNRYKENEKVTIKADTMILVCPVYFQTLPHIVKTFISKLEFEQTRIQIYAVATCNAGPGHALFSLDGMLKKRGQALKGGFVIDMPGNSIIVKDFTNPPEVREKRLKESEIRIKEISESINNELSCSIEGSNKIKNHLQGFITGGFAKYLYKTPTKFSASQACSKCKTCVRVCPCGNIQMSAEGIKWGRHCEHCLACFHWCPNTAIELGNNTIGKTRYHHPNVSVSDMFIEK